MKIRIIIHQELIIHMINLGSNTMNKFLLFLIVCVLLSSCMNFPALNEPPVRWGLSHRSGAN